MKENKSQDCPIQFVKYFLTILTVASSSNNLIVMIQFENIQLKDFRICYQRVNQTIPTQNY